MRLIDADMLDEEVMHLFIAITGTPKQSTVVNECKKSFRKMIDEQPTIDVPDTNVGKQTNADWIRSMTDEDLADVFSNFLESLDTCYTCPFDKYHLPCVDCKTGILKWMKLESE